MTDELATQRAIAAAATVAFRRRIEARAAARSAVETLRALGTQAVAS